jgi:hypothetical protein
VTKVLPDIMVALSFSCYSLAGFTLNKSKGTPLLFTLCLDAVLAGHGRISYIWPVWVIAQSHFVSLFRYTLCS